jgi:hypothetical protein
MFKGDPRPLVAHPASPWAHCARRHGEGQHPLRQRFPATDGLVDGLPDKRDDQCRAEHADETAYKKNQSPDRHVAPFTRKRQLSFRADRHKRAKLITRGRKVERARSGGGLRPRDLGQEERDDAVATVPADEPACVDHALIGRSNEPAPTAGGISQHQAAESGEELACQLRSVRTALPVQPHTHRLRPEVVRTERHPG